MFAFIVVAPSLTPDGLQLSDEVNAARYSCSSLSHPGWLTIFASRSPRHNQL